MEGHLIGNKWYKSFSAIDFSNAFNKIPTVVYKMF